MGNNSGKDIYQIKITLIGTEPIIWRQMLVQSGIFLSNFHEILQRVMGWTDSHLHQFVPPHKPFPVQSKPASTFPVRNAPRNPQNAPLGPTRNPAKQDFS